MAISRGTGGTDSPSQPPISPQAARRWLRITRGIALRFFSKPANAPNSPQWFNTGLHWACGIDGPAQGHYYVDYRTAELTRSESAYEHSQPHACFIQSVADDLVNEDGIMDLWVKSLKACVDEARAKRRIVA